MKRSGLLVDVYRDAHGDCTLNGISSKFDTLLLILPEGGPFKEDETKWPSVVLDKREEMGIRLGHNCTRAVPSSIMESGKWSMMGGNFIWTTDSRFPANHPIPIHDRVEN